MSRPTHIIRFIAKEDHRVHLGQLIDPTRDVGLDSLEGRAIQAYLINGSIFNGEVRKNQILTVERLLSPVAQDQCTYVRCLGLNYIDHAKVSRRSKCPGKSDSPGSHHLASNYLLVLETFEHECTDLLHPTLTCFRSQK